MIPAPDGFQYGVRFQDGSVASPWNGSTQRTRAEVALVRLAEAHEAWIARRGEEARPHPYAIVRRRPGQAWEEIPA